jgi:hypothetical protein
LAENSVSHIFYNCFTKDCSNDVSRLSQSTASKKETKMKRHLSSSIIAMGCALAASPIISYGQTATIVGYPANFDAVNNTGQVTHGFEIEADGIQSSDITRIFGGSWVANGPCNIRYCEGTATDFPGGVYIRWMSPWDPNTGQFTQGTPLPDGTYVGGESCWTGGLGSSYPNAGCDHFGISSFRNPSTVTYRWLVADPQNPGQLIRFAAASGSGVAAPPPTPVAIPQPIVYLVAPAAPGGQPIVNFDIEAAKAPPVRPFVQPQFGPAQWVKVYKNEIVGEADLNDLLIGNPVVPGDAQVETEWQLLQKNPNSMNSGILHHQGALGNGNHSVIRRYTFYKYSGNLDPLSGEALCASADCSAPSAGELGDLIGNQMAAANVETPSVTVAKVGTGTVNGTGAKISCGNVCTANVDLGTAVSLTASVPGNAVFGGWTGDCTGNNTTCSLTVNKALSTTVTFTPVFTLSIGHGGSGTVTGTPQGAFNTFIGCGSSCSAKFPQGTAVTLTAAPAAGLKFINWTGGCSGSVPTCTLSIVKDVSVQANFK